MPQGKLVNHLVSVTPALPLAQDVALGDELREDPVGGALRDAHCSCDLTQPNAGVGSHAHQHVCVIRQEIPATGSNRFLTLIS